MRWCGTARCDWLYAAIGCRVDIETPDYSDASASSPLAPSDEPVKESAPSSGSLPFTLNHLPPCSAPSQNRCSPPHPAHPRPPPSSLAQILYAHTTRRLSRTTSRPEMCVLASVLAFHWSFRAESASFNLITRWALCQRTTSMWALVSSAHLRESSLSVVLVGVGR